MKYQDIYNQSVQQPEAFWQKMAEELHWQEFPKQILDAKRPPFYKWFADGKINICQNALDRHVDQGRGDQPALIYDSPVTNTQRTWTFVQLRDETAKLAGALAANGITKGDRVIIYMPMIPQAVMAMLACARLGAIHSVVFGGFAAEQLATRLDDAQAKLVLTASCGIEPQRIVEYKPLLDKAIALCKHKPAKCIVLQRPQHPAKLNPPRDLDWEEAIAKARPADCAVLNATDELFILYTSGTTGFPKGVIHDIGGYAVALQWTMTHLYDAQPGDVYWAASDVGWIVGHSYIVYGPLLHGCATIVYEGKPVGTPDAGAFWRVIARHKVKVLFTAPTALRAIKKEDPQGKLTADYDLSALKALFLAGERCDPDTLKWAEERLKVPTIDHWWQTETGWAITGLPTGIEAMPIKSGAAGVPMVGYDVSIFNHAHKQVATGELGAIAVKLPLPPGTFPNLWRNEKRYLQALEIIDGYYMTGDAGYKDADNYVYVMSRTDDIINVAGHRLSTGQMEEILTSHQDVAEAAVFGVNDEIKGQTPLGLVIKNANSQLEDEQLAAELIQLIRDKLGPVAAFKSVAAVARLPKTRSGKILRAVMRKVANAESWDMPATIDDPAIMDEIASALTQLGYPR